MIYVDTSSLAALYYPESKSQAVADLVSRGDAALPFTWLHELELVNSVELKRFRDEVSDEQAEATLAAIHADAESGVYWRAGIEWPHVFEHSLRLSVDHTHHVGARALDLLHVATAIVLEVDDFVTSDARQAEAAESSGLDTTLIA